MQQHDGRGEPLTRASSASATEAREVIGESGRDGQLLGPSGKFTSPGSMCKSTRSLQLTSVSLRSLIRLSYTNGRVSTPSSSPSPNPSLSPPSSSTPFYSPILPLFPLYSLFTSSPSVSLSSSPRPPLTNILPPPSPSSPPHHPPQFLFTF